MTVALAKAKSVGSTTNPVSGGGFGAEGSKFKIKVGAVDFSGFCQLEPTTGDGDAGHTSSENEPVHRIALSGWMVSDDAIGLENLGDSSATFELLLTATRKITATAKVANYHVRWRRTAGVIPVSLTLEVQNATLTEATVSA